MVATFLAGVEAEVAGDEQADLVGEYGWPDRAEVASVLALAVRLRLGGAPAYAQSRVWGAAARRVALVVLLVHAVWSVLDVGMEVWISGSIPVLPSAPPDAVGASSVGEWGLVLAGFGGGRHGRSELRGYRSRKPPVWVFLHPDAVYCLLVVVAAAVCLAHRAARSGNGPAGRWPSRCLPRPR